MIGSLSSIPMFPLRERTTRMARARTFELSHLRVEQDIAFQQKDYVTFCSSENTATYGVRHLKTDGLWECVCGVWGLNFPYPLSQM